MAIKTLDQAIRDATAIADYKVNQRFQPGVETPLTVLDEEKEALLQWLDNPDYCGFEWWCRAAKLPPEVVEDRRKDLRELLNGNS